jgi:hypothetical protein
MWPLAYGGFQKKATTFFRKFYKGSYIAHSQPYIAIPGKTPRPKAAGLRSFPVEKAATEAGEAGVGAQCSQLPERQRVWGW